MSSPQPPKRKEERTVVSLERRERASENPLPILPEDDQRGKFLHTLTTCEPSSPQRRFLF